MVEERKEHLNFHVIVTWIFQWIKFWIEWYSKERMKEKENDRENDRVSKRMKMSFVVFFQNLSIECSALVYFSNFAIIRAFRFVFRLNSLGCSIVVARYYHCIRIFIALSLACASDILFAIWKFIKHMIRDLFVYLHFERISFAICVCVCLCVCAVA